VSNNQPDRPMSIDHREPFANSRFRVEIEGFQGTGATEVIFPEARIVEGQGKARVVQYGSLTLRRGMTTSSEWYQWWDDARSSATVARKSVTVVLMDRLHADVHRWTFSRALPTGYVVSPLNALGGEPVIETLELSVAGFKIAFGEASVQSNPAPPRGALRPTSAQ
jgi:phage tail-like protein